MAASADEPNEDGKSGPLSEKRVQELVEDAWLYATYGRYAGSFRDARLFEAVADALRERPPSERLVVELQNALNQTARDIPYETVAALKGGWSPGRPHWLTKLVTFVLVIFSILLMLSVAQLTLVHNRGADLVEELSDIVADAPGAQLQRMIEDHARDRLELESASPSSPGDFLADYVPASLLSRQRDDIKDLSRSVTRTVDEVGRYLSNDSRFPLMGTKEAYCGLGTVFSFDGVAYNAYCATSAPLDLANLQEAMPAAAPPQDVGEETPEDAPANADGAAEDGAAEDGAAEDGAGDDVPAPPPAPEIGAAEGGDAEAELAAKITGLGELTPASAAGPPALGGAAPPGCPSYLGYDDLAAGSTLEKWTALFRREIEVMRCARTLTYDPTVQSFGLTSQLDELKRRVGYYALWILPALYGAMGAVMYHMRWVLDPLLPHPSLLRLAHRIVLGALAGIVLGWFYSPGTAISDAADRVGFSLFVVAFFFGFSLDIFFALLDRLVSRSERSIRAGKDDQHDDSALLSLLRGRQDEAGDEPPAGPAPGPQRKEEGPNPPITFSRSSGNPA